MNLDFLPSPVEDRPGLLIRDGLGYTDVSVIIPPPLVGCLPLFDGEGTDLDLRQMLVRITGELQVGDLESNLIDSLSRAGFLEDGVYDGLRQARHREFAESPVRRAAHAGAAYPGDPELLRAGLRGILTGGDGQGALGELAGIAAPHVSFEGGHSCYQAAYGALPPELNDRTFVVLGTSHHGPPEKFGLTRKPFETPLGTAVTAVDLVEEMAALAPDGAEMEDYHHSVEHSIEFQVLVLQHLFGAGVRILPVLCGAYLRSMVQGGLPEDDPGVARFLEALRGIAQREGNRLFWVLGIDLAHQGRRYGDDFSVVADRGEMTGVSSRDRFRLERIEAGDAEGFWSDIQRGGDSLRWCGASVLYTFLRAMPGARGRVLRYGQWNIDEASVVTFGAMAFHR